MSENGGEHNPSIVLLPSKEQYDDEEEHQPEEQENINNSKIIEELKEKNNLIQYLKDEKENLEYQLNQTRAKLT